MTPDTVYEKLENTFLMYVFGGPTFGVQVGSVVVTVYESVPLPAGIVCAVCAETMQLPSIRRSKHESSLTTNAYEQLRFVFIEYLLANHWACG